MVLGTNPSSLTNHSESIFLSLTLSTFSTRSLYNDFDTTDMCKLLLLLLLRLLLARSTTIIIPPPLLI